jgi:hypothetical protein
VALKLIADLAPVEELLAMVSCPVVTPAAMGSNSTSNIAVWPGFNVAGKLSPDIVKPVPVSVAELMVTGAVPVDVRVTDCVAAVFTCTFPKGMLAALRLSVGTAAFNCRVKLSDTLPALAFRVTVWAVLTDETVAVNPAVIAFAGTVTVAGAVTAALLLARLTLRPPLGAAAFSVTVQASVPEPVIDALLQESALNAAAGVAAMPVPLRLITNLALVDELLAMVN